MRLALLAVLPFVAAACVSPFRPPRPQAVPAAPVAAPQDPRESIARLEDLRTDGEGLLQALAARGEENTRVRAVRALGRLPYEAYGAVVSGPLAAALEDHSGAVREAAAFALGMRGDPSTTGALVAAASDGSARLRERAVEALSRIDDARARRAVVDALDDEAPAVRGAAAIGIHRFPRDVADAAAAESALVDRLEAGEDDEFRWRALSTLARRGATRARLAFEAGATAADPRARLFALQGLGSVPADERTASILTAALADPDWRVAVEAARALGRQADPRGVGPLVEATRRSVPPHAAHHVRREALAALGAIPAAADAARPALERARNDESRAVRAAALIAGARLVGASAQAALESAARDADPVVRAGAAAALAHLPAGLALALLEPLLSDPERLVSTAAAEALGAHVRDAAARARLVELLADADNGTRLAAATALKGQVGTADLASLARALATTRGEIAAEVAAAVVDAAAPLGEAAWPLLEAAIAHEEPFVSAKARAAALAIRPGARLPRPGPGPRRSGPLPDLRDGPNPRVAFETTKGVLVFELEAAEAPFHVENLVRLARAGHYDGTTFHRVVPDFVVQGGDRRGDGNGGQTWRGPALRAEFGPRPFRRGSLGMPRNDDPDSGGSQIFVCHRETPHLDGRYTRFGELVEGFDVLDALCVGDRILAVRVLSDEG